MAKISARGATELGRWALTVTSEDGDQEVPVGSALLRSDGVILRKSTLKGDRWTAWLRLKPSTTKPISAVRAQAALEARGYVVRRVG
jgi:hypothetical protein